MGFKVPFNITDYKDILPDPYEYLKNDFIINGDDFTKGNSDLCLWQKQTLKSDEVTSKECRQREANRILRTGVWVAIKDEIVWIPPQYYFALNYGKTGGDNLEFRLKRLMHCYFKIRARNNPQCKATMTIKNRQDGETTMSISDAFWETFDMEDGQIGIISKTRADAINPCWKTMQTLWMNLPYWLKDDLCPDFSSGTNIAETMKFMRMADERTGVSAKNVLLAYYPAVFNAMDGKNNMRKVIVDEFLKWIECNFGDFFNNASKFIMPGFERRGMFDMFSSPPEKDSRSFRDGYELWQRSDPNKLMPNGTTESRVHRYYSNPLHGIQGAYDKWGDADPDKIYDWIMAERAKQPKSKLLEEIRGFPLNEEEIWGSMEGGAFWDNTKGIQSRQIYLLNRRFKDDVSQEPVKIFGNLEWKDGIVDNPAGVDFRQSDKSEFDVNEARWCLPFLPKDLPVLPRIQTPPEIIQSVMGVDPFAKRHPGKNPSNGAAAIYQFSDIFETGRKKTFTGLYNNRPYHEDIFFEDCLKGCIFTHSLLQFENNHDRIGGYFTDRGYKDWVIPTIGEARGSDKLGDAVTARGKFMDEMIILINAYTNIPVDPLDECLLERVWLSEILDDLLKFNLKDTHENDITMAVGQALMGAAKLLLKKVREKSKFNDLAIGYFIDL